MPSPSPAAPAAPPPAAEQPAYPATLALSLLAFHRHVGPIFKGTDAKYGKFADLLTVLDVVTPPLLEQGLVLTQTLTAGPETAGPQGATLLRTQLLHAPSGQELTSDLALPTLDSLLARLHDLRLAALSGFSFDLQLAALGTVPPALPPKPTPPAAAAPDANGNGAPAATEKPLLPPPSLSGPAAARQPGLRLDDQIKGFYGTLQSLGTTTNPLHSIGGAVTYFRRYAILAILSLAAEDNDGADYGDPEDRQPQDGRAATRGRARNVHASPQAAPTSQTPAPRPAQARSRRAAPAADQAAPSAQTQTAAPAPAATPQPVAAAPAAPTTAAPAAELTPAEIQALIGLIRSLPNESIPPLIAAFRQHFGLPEAALVSDYIATRDHAAFIEQRVQELTPVAV